ncbi:HIT family protein [Actinoplanes sp. NPDC049265]|uniref:HIT family protein n=1 Tax=Actinoplanes sp. NPDC049265 TaxID=3363902 RepID=UPI0037237C35
MAGCLFCAIVAGDVPAFRVAESPSYLAFLDIRPVFKGHVLVVPRPHVPQLTDLDLDLLPGFFTFVQEVAAAVPAALGAQGTFVAMNNVVSQSVPHLHAHVVPRTKGDGLRGFFWPRTKYASDDEAVSYAERIGKELGDGGVTPAG